MDPFNGGFCILASSGPVLSPRLQFDISRVPRPAPTAYLWTARIRISVVCGHKFKGRSALESSLSISNSCSLQISKTCVESCPLRPAQTKAADLSDKMGFGEHGWRELLTGQVRARCRWRSVASK